MSILIKGMKMPEKCGSCDLFHVESPMHCTVVKGHKTVGAPYGMPRPDWCPLVEVPESHGDLIDRKAPEIIYCHECIHFQCNMRFDGSVPKGADAYECRRGCGGCDPMDYCCYGERAERRSDADD